MVKVRIDFKERAYSLGEIVSGAIHLSLDKPVAQRKATAYVLGREETRVRVSWGPSVDFEAGYSWGVPLVPHETGRAVNDFLVKNLPISLPMDDKGMFKPGDYTIPFQFMLTQGFPATYKGKHVSITYAITVKIDLPHRRDMKRTSEFAVLQSSLPTVHSQPNEADLEPTDGEDIQSVGPTSKPGIKFTVDKGECSRGGVISGRCSLINTPLESLKEIDIDLIWFEKAVAQHQRAITEIFRESSKVPIPSPSYRGWLPFTIRVPSEAPLTYQSTLSSIKCRLVAEINVPFRWKIHTSTDINVRPRTVGAVAATDKVLLPGEPTAGAWRCQNCQAVVVPPHATYCPNCGTAVMGSAEGATPFELEGKPERVRQARGAASCGKECMVCDLEFKIGEDVVWCPHCSNAAHRAHLVEWVRSKHTCPMCRASLKDADFKRRSAGIL